MDDQKRAQIYLAHRQNGFSIGLAYRLMSRRYLLNGILMALLVFLVVASPRQDPILWLLIGLYAGMFTQDLGWFLGSKKAWPFVDKVTDWGKVEAIAKGEAPPSA